MLLSNGNMALKKDSMAQCHARNGQTKHLVKLQQIYNYLVSILNVLVFIFTYMFN